MKKHRDPERVIEYRWRMPGRNFCAWTHWGLYKTREQRDEMLESRRAKYAWSDRFEFRAAA